jgi:hypothetical protein
MRLHSPWKVPIHIPRRLVREGHREQALRRHLGGLDQPGNARRQHAGLAAAGAGEDQGGLVRKRDGSELLLVEVVQQIHERPTV